MTAPFGRRAVPVTARREVGPYTVVAVDDTGAPAPRPGQFFMLATVEGWGGGDGERPFLPRAFSHLRTHSDGRLEFMLEDVGPGTARLCELDPGGEVWLAGPFGNGFTLPGDGERAVLCAGGVGVAPIAALADELAGTAPVLLGFRDGPHAQGAGLVGPEAVVATDDGSVGRPGRVTELLVPTLGPGSVVYACGPPPMLEAVRAICAERDVPVQLALESGMACGFGACFGCVVPTRSGLVRLCLDGPVLAGAELDHVVHP